MNFLRLYKSFIFKDSEEKKMVKARFDIYALFLNVIKLTNLYSLFVFILYDFMFYRKFKQNNFQLPAQKELFW